MNKLAALSIALLFTQASFAADTSPKAVMADSEITHLVGADQYNWLAVAANTVWLMPTHATTEQSFTKVREFNDMGSAGVQQIDYVVNCSANTMALADFAVMTAQGRLPVAASDATLNTLSFYKPVIEHDQKIAANTCSKQTLALDKNANPSVN